MKFELQRVEFMPKDLDAGVVYFAEEYGACAHLCACGCGTKIRTPIAPTEWALEEGDRGVSLCPSIGNWQRPCRSHYWIIDGEVKWSSQWTDEQVFAGRKREAARRDEYFGRKRAPRWRTVVRRAWRWISGR